MATAANSHSFSTNRNSLGSHQLPLPSGLNAPPNPRAPTSPTVPAAAPATPRTSVALLPHSPVSPSFALPPLPHGPPPAPTHMQHTSSTHAGGIQPSASFFRPSRPTYHPDYSRPSSPSSLHHSQIPDDRDVFQLAPISSPQHQHHNISIHMDGGEDENQSVVGESEQDHGLGNGQQQFLSAKRTKQSREPLLPGPGAGGSPSKAKHQLGGAYNTTSIPTPTSASASTPTRDQSGSNATPKDPPRSATRLVRTSLDRVLSISRGLSFDSVRRSGAPPGSAGARAHDEEHALGLHIPTHAQDSPVTPTYKHSLDVRGPAASRRHSRTISHTHSHSVSHRTSALTAPSRSPTPSRSPSPSASPSSPSPSPSSFIPHPPPHHPPLSHTPLLSPSTHKPLRRYQLHPSRNRFYLQGRVLAGGDTPWAFVASISVLLGIAGCWFGTTARWWWHEEGVGGKVLVGVAAYLALLTVETMVVTATTDPGILPRGLDPDPPYPATSPSDGGVRVPMPRDLKVRSDVVRVKYCPTCKTYRPPRSSHCKMCDNCVDDCDHHCQWVNNCIGRRNYTTFFALLVFATTTLILIIITSALHLWLLTARDSEGRGFLYALRHGRGQDGAGGNGGVGSAVAFCLAVAVVWPVGALLSYHMRLLLLNITTIEQIRNQAHKIIVPGPPPPNPFSHGSWRRNVFAVLCRPKGYSWLDAHAIATEDKREVNPGNLGLGEEGEAWRRSE